MLPDFLQHFMHRRSGQNLMHCIFSFDGFKNVIEIKTNRSVVSGEEATLAYTAKGNRISYQLKGGGTCVTHDAENEEITITKRDLPPGRKRRGSFDF